MILYILKYYTYLDCRDRVEMKTPVFVMKAD